MPILNVAVGPRTIDQSCVNCGQQNLAIPFATLALFNASAVPGSSAISITCPNCGAVECLNTNLGPEDEGVEVRGQQAKRIRALQVLLGLSRRNTQARGG